MTLALTLAAALVVGVALGLLGGGGSILTVPILVYIAGVEAKTAIAMSLFVVGVTSAVSVLPHALAGRVRWRTGLLFGAAGMVGAYAGGWIGHYIPATVLLAGFAVMMAVTAAAMLRRGRATDSPQPDGGHGHPGARRPVPRILLEGVTVGLITGLVGAGGGFLVVPALMLLGGLSMPAAVGTSLVVIAMKSLAGLAGYLQHVHLDWRLTLAVTAAAVLGSLAGSRLTGMINPDRLRTAFGWFIIAMSAFVLTEQAPQQVRHTVLGTPVGWAALAGVTAIPVIRARRTRQPVSPRRDSGRPRPTIGGTTMPQAATRHHVLIVGGGTAGLATAARLRRAGVTGIAVLDPSETHWYQPLWTLVGGGRADLESTRRPQSSLIPEGVHWIRDAASCVDPGDQRVTTASGGTIGYDFLVMAPGIQLDWEATDGLAEAISHNGVTSNYTPELAPRTWAAIRGLRAGTAVFTQPAGPVKCAGAPQKIAYLAADHWRREGRLDRIRVILVLPDPVMFKVPEWARGLERVAARYGIEVRLQSEMIAIDPENRELTITNNAEATKETLPYDMVHAVPPQSAPDWVKNTPLADPASPFGYIEVDRHTLVHPRYPNVFTLGDVANLPTSKTGAAIRKQAPVVVRNLIAAEKGVSPAARYNGYTSCPLVTARNRMMLAEFDYDLRPAPSIPLIDTRKERYDMWLLKRYGLPALYWHAILKGRL